MKPTFVLLASVVATLLSSSCNTYEQEQPTLQLDPSGMTTEFAYHDTTGAYYRKTITDSIYIIEDSTGVLAERFKNGSWNIQNTYLAFEAMYKIDSAISKMQNKDSTP